MALDFGYWSALTGPMQTAGQRAQNRDAQNLQAMQLMQQMKQMQLKNLENTKGLQDQVNASHTAAMDALYTKDKKFRRQKDVEDFKDWQRDMSGWGDIQALLRQYGSVENARLHGNLDYVLQEYKNNIQNNPISQRVNKNKAAVELYYSGVLDEGKGEGGIAGGFELIPANAHKRFQEWNEGKTDYFRYSSERSDYLSHPKLAELAESQNITLDDVITHNYSSIIKDMVLDINPDDPDAYVAGLTEQDIKTWVSTNTGHSQSGGLDYFTQDGYSQAMYGETDLDTNFSTDLVRALKGVTSTATTIDDLLDIKEGGSSFNNEFVKNHTADFSFLGGVDENSSTVGPGDRGLFGQSWFTKDRQIIGSPKIFANPNVSDNVTTAVFKDNEYDPKDGMLYDVSMKGVFTSTGHQITQDDTENMLGNERTEGDSGYVMIGDEEVPIMDLKLLGYHVVPKVVGKDGDGNSTTMLITDVKNEADLKKIKDHWSDYEVQYTIVAELEDSDFLTYYDQYYKEVDLSDANVQMAINEKFDKKNYNEVKGEMIDLDKRNKISAKKNKTQAVLKAKLANDLNLPNTAAVDEVVDAYSQNLSVGLLNAGVSNKKTNAVMPMLISDIYLESQKPREYPFIMEKDQNGRPTIVAETPEQYMAHYSQKLKLGLNSGQNPYFQEMLEAINGGPSAYDKWRKSKLDKSSIGKTNYLSRQMAKYYHGRD
tara:strand:- start:4280 stop:6409 length:2130 start_codon:yes stop_codon:yes gene_type:complete